MNRTDTFIAAVRTAGNVASVSKVEGAAAVRVTVTFKTHGTFPEESKADYRYIRETARIYGADKLRAAKDSFGRYETLAMEFGLDN